MNIESFRREMNAFREGVEREALYLKNTSLVHHRLSDMYEGLSLSGRTYADQIIGEWALSEDEGVRFDAQALIWKFRILGSLSMLRELMERLAKSSDAGAPFEMEKVERLISELLDDSSEKK